MKTILLRSLMWLVLALVAAVALAPFLLMLVMSTQNNFEIFSGATLRPGSHLMQNYQAIMAVNFPRAILNSAVIAVSTMALSVFFSAMAGFGFSKYEFRGKKLLFNVVLGTMMVPMEASFVAFLWQMRKMGLAQTFWPLILPNIANGFGVFWMSSFMRDSVPYEILESGRVDGCSDLGIFLRLIFPIVRPALYSLGVIAFLQSWNSYTLPMVMISRSENYTVPLAIASLGNMQIADYGARILGVVVGIAPIVILFLFTSRYVTEGLTMGSVKG